MVEREEGGLFVRSEGLGCDNWGGRGGAVVGRWQGWGLGCILEFGVDLIL